MKRISRWGRMVSLLMVVAMVLAACSGTSDTTTTPAESDTPPGTSDSDTTVAESNDPSSDEPVTIEYFSFSAGEDNLPRLEAIVAAFEAENPNIKVDLRQADFGSYFTALQTRIAGNDAPDAFELNYENFVTYADAGALLDLEASAPEIMDASVYYPGAYEAFNHNGVQYGLPGSFSVVVLYYNRDLFDQAGLDYPDASWTWEEEAAAADAINALGDDIWGDYQPVQFFEFYKALAQNGGEFFNEDKSEATFNSPEGVAAAEWLVNKIGDVMPTTEEMGGQGDDALFKSGQIGMWHTGIWMFGAMDGAEINWDIAVEPGNVSNASHFFSNGVVASANTEHPVEVATFLHFLASSEVMVNERLDAGWELPAVADEELLAPYLELSPPDNREAVFQALESVVTPPVIVKQQQLQDIVTLALERAVLGEVSVQDALDQAAAEVNELLG